ncbi:hypothetical protein RB612 [Rhodopirellula baltica SH 1]|uniref:Uncharacterized protein n=1 Tax=Rhodopirellula baltica (strain DSM 10527 / NCIMB 13988 / SH1) TaxID=243090 RepID=Q7UYH1_RHOBA|nr:hypothetical protein RB612 [Rhodopirellula baltica SH 1]
MSHVNYNAVADAPSPTPTVFRASDRYDSIDFELSLRRRLFRVVDRFCTEWIFAVA